jgi:hypothetical protein
MPARKLRQHHDHFATRSIHVGSEPDHFTGAVVPSLSVATTFVQDGIGKHKVGWVTGVSVLTTGPRVCSFLQSDPLPAGGALDVARDVANFGDLGVFPRGRVWRRCLRLCVWIGCDRGNGLLGVVAERGRRGRWRRQRWRRTHFGDQRCREWPRGSLTNTSTGARRGSSLALAGQPGSRSPTLTWRKPANKASERLYATTPR